MKDGKKGNLFFLLASHPLVTREFLMTMHERVSGLRCFSERLTAETIEFCHAISEDALATSESSLGSRLRKNYPDTVVFLSFQDDGAQGKIDDSVDYVLSIDGFQEELRGIILAERQRRQVINTKLINRHCFDYTATALVLNEDHTQILLIPKPGGRLFPPGGHVEAGEYPHEAVIREVREETGYEILFLNQPEGIGKQIGAALVLPLPYQVVRVDLTTHYHHDFLYLCQIGGLRHHTAEFEGQWVPREDVQKSDIPEDIHSVLTRLLAQGI